MTFTELLGCNGVIGVIGQTGIVDPRDIVLSLKPERKFERVLRMSLNTKGQCFDYAVSINRAMAEGELTALEQKESVLR